MDEHDSGLDIGPHLPDDARRKGLTATVAPGVQLAASLRHDRLPHRILALLALGSIAVFVMICALTVLSGG